MHIIALWRIFPYIPPTGRLWSYASRPHRATRTRLCTETSIDADWPPLPSVPNSNLVDFWRFYNKTAHEAAPKRQKKTNLSGFVVQPEAKSTFLPRLSESSKVSIPLPMEVRKRRNGVEPAKSGPTESPAYSKLIQSMDGVVKLPANHYALSRSGGSAWPTPADWATLPAGLGKKRTQTLKNGLPHYASAAASAILRKMELPDDHPMRPILEILSLPDHMLLEIASNMPAWMLAAALYTREETGDRSAGGYLYHWAEKNRQKLRKKSPQAS